MRRLVPPHILRLMILLAVLCALELVATFVFYDRLLLRLAMPWNVFLAVLPLLFALGILHREAAGRPLPLTLLLGLVWLVFYPNAPYIITDFIHLNRTQFFDQTYRFLPDVDAWLGLLHLAVGVIAGCVAGQLSLYLVQGAVARRLGRAAGWWLVAVVSLLSGFAIYIGRFMRFNTWDLLVRPLDLVRRVWQSLGPETFALYAVFAALTIVSYLPLYFSLTGGERRS